MNGEVLAAWCGEVAAGFRGHEHRTQEPLRRDRDTALVEYAIRSLATGADPTTGNILEGIDRHRAGTGDAA